MKSTDRILGNSPFRSLDCLHQPTHLLAPHCLLCLRAPLRSLVCLLAHSLLGSWDSAIFFSNIQSVLKHCALIILKIKLWEPMELPCNSVFSVSLRDIFSTVSIISLGISLWVNWCYKQKTFLPDIL